ncbi:MAG: PAS domain S-box protein [Holophagales bacterium]|nr:PAS domain S-box protein [Holophagales bacterium]
MTGSVSEKPAESPKEVAPTGPPLPGLVIGENYAVAAFEALPEGVVLHLASGEIVICNPAAERILGLTRSQMAGRTSLDPSWQAIREDGSPFPGETHPAMVTLRTGEPLRDVVMGSASRTERPAGSRSARSLSPGRTGRFARSSRPSSTSRTVISRRRSLRRRGTVSSEPSTTAPRRSS